MTRWEELGMSPEEYVRSRWNLVHCCDGSYRGYPRGTVLVQDVNGHWLDFASWSVAAEFTRQRKEEIRQVREEMSLLTSQVRHEWAESVLSPPDGAQQCYVVRALRFERILARFESALAKLTKGWKG